MSKPIFLIGYMACGKTTFGRALADAANRRFVDLDQYIEAQQGMSVSRIFAAKGETYFRSLESAALAELARSSEPMVIACGGGTPCNSANMDLMLASGFTVWLDAPINVLMRRLLADRQARPLVAKISDVAELQAYVLDNLKLREKHYSRADIKFDSSLLETPQQIAHTVRLFTDQYL